LGAAVLVLRGGEWWDEFANPADVQVPTSPERLQTFSSNNRWLWWTEAWRGFEEEPIAGTGAGSFAYTHLRLRKSDQFVVEPHNVALQFLSETGLIGFLLFAGAAAASAVAVARTLHVLRGANREAVVALALVPLAFLLHSLLDYHWDFVALAAPSFVVLGYLLAAAREPERTPPRRPLIAISAVALAAGALVSLGSPWLAERRVSEAYDLLLADPGRAAAKASDAHDLNALSVEPLFAWAAAEEARGDLREALGRYEQAARLQPKNADAWRTLATFELEVLRNPDRALAHFDCMYALDPLGPALDLLDEARERAKDPSTSCPR
jgi:tetratricopeptide (TPR) repeat protein